MVFKKAEDIEESAKLSKRRSLYGNVINKADNVTSSKFGSMINFNSPIFKLLNLKIELEAVTNFNYKSYEDLVSSREKQ